MACGNWKTRTSMKFILVAVDIRLSFQTSVSLEADVLAIASRLSNFRDLPPSFKLTKEVEGVILSICFHLLSILSSSDHNFCLLDTEIHSVLLPAITTGPLVREELTRFVRCRRSDAVLAIRVVYHQHTELNYLSTSDWLCTREPV